jgi:hypothetical protein
MTIRRCTWFALAILGVLAAASALWSVFGPDRIVLTTSQIQARINRSLPREFRGVTVEQATVTVADDRVALRVETRAAVLGQTFSAVVHARGVPRFSPDRGEFFFDADEVKVTDFAATGGSVAGRLDRLGASFKERAEALAGKMAAAGLRAYLAERPVYRFKDDLKGIVLKAAVSNVAIQGDAVLITVSLVTLTVMTAVSLAALLAIAFLMVQLFRHPDWAVSVVEAALDSPS